MVPTNRIVIGTVVRTGSGSRIGATNGVNRAAGCVRMRAGWVIRPGDAAPCTMAARISASLAATPGSANEDVERCVKAAGELVDKVMSMKENAGTAGLNPDGAPNANPPPGQSSSPPPVG